MKTTSNRQYLQGAQQSRRISEWIVANRFSHRQLIHILQQRKHKSHKDGARLVEKSNVCSINSQLSHPRTSTSCKTGASMVRSRDCQPSHTNGSLLDLSLSAPILFIPVSVPDYFSAYHGEPVLFETNTMSTSNYLGSIRFLDLLRSPFGLLREPRSVLPLASKY